MPRRPSRPADNIFAKEPRTTEMSAVMVRFPTKSSAEVLHNHDSRPKIEYAGFSGQYHLYRCVMTSDPPRKPVRLVPYDPAVFSPDSKAAHGACSGRGCVGDAVRMKSSKGERSYCERCAEKTSEEPTPCPWTSIIACPRKMKLDEFPYARKCSICASEE